MLESYSIIVSNGGPILLQINLMHYRLPSKTRKPLNSAPCAGKAIFTGAMDLIPPSPRTTGLMDDQIVVPSSVSD